MKNYYSLPTTKVTTPVKRPPKLASKIFIKSEEKVVVGKEVPLVKVYEVEKKETSREQRKQSENQFPTQKVIQKIIEKYIYSENINFVYLQFNKIMK